MYIYIYMCIYIYISGWWLRKNPSEKYEFVNWDDDIHIWKNKNHVPKHQPVFFTMKFATLWSRYHRMFLKRNPAGESRKPSTHLQLSYDATMRVAL